LKRRPIVSQLVTAALSIAAIAFTTQHIDPVFAGRTRGVGQVFARSDWRDEALARAPWNAESEATLVSAPWASMSSDSATRTPQFEADRRAFTLDLLRTGQLQRERADSLATFAVREAYLRKVPPALVFGVMLTENARFESKANSNVGAVGLMQIYPRYWIRELGERFGTNLNDDETNLRYGVFILSRYLDNASDDSADVGHFVRRGLLKYNGCVRGTNTHNCKQYPDVVRARIEQYAVAQCGTLGYDGCVAEPLRRKLQTAAILTASTVSSD
jgi:hypothetical protein